MLTYNINDRGETPIYEYLYKCIRGDIMAGRLEQGTKLPSKREFAADNGVALITVENAYAQLIVEGYIEARPRRGYFVQDVSEIYLGEDDDKVGIDSRLGQSIGDIEPPQIDSRDIRTSDTFPYATWSKLMRRVLNDRESDFEIAPPSEGVYELRKAIATYLHNSKNLAVDPNCIVVGPGTEYLHSIVIQLVGRNRLVAVEDPGYKKAAQIYESNGMKVMHIPVDDEGIVVDKLEGSGIKLVHCSPAHHFPTGIVMSADRRHRFLNWAAGQAAYIIEDDYDSEFRFKGLPLPTLMSLDHEHVIYMNTFTGTLAPSIRVAYMVLPERLMEIYHQRLSFLSGTVSTFDQLTLAAFISEGFYERHISRMRNRYRKIRETYRQAFDHSLLRKRARIIDDPAGLNMILEFIDDWDETTLNEHVRARQKLKPMNEYCYYQSDRYKRKFIMRYRDLDEDKLVEIFDSMV